MADPFFSLQPGDQSEVLAAAAAQTGRPKHLLEKDVWVVWTLSSLFGSPVGQNLVFKGGTSLSKAYGVIGRFSEDVDLTYDIRQLLGELVKDREDALPKRRAKKNDGASVFVMNFQFGLPTRSFRFWKRHLNAILCQRSSGAKTTNYSSTTRP